MHRAAVPHINYVSFYARLNSSGETVAIYLLVVYCGGSFSSESIFHDWHISGIKVILLSFTIRKLFRRAGTKVWSEKFRIIPNRKYLRPDANFIPSTLLLLSQNKSLEDHYKKS